MKHAYTLDIDPLHLYLWPHFVRHGEGAWRLYFGPFTLARVWVRL